MLDQVKSGLQNVSWRIRTSITKALLKDVYDTGEIQLVELQGLDRDLPETSRLLAKDELVSLVDLEFGINATLVIGSVMFDESEAGGRITKMELYPPGMEKQC